MPEKINLIFTADNLQDFANRIKEIAKRYVSSLNKPTQPEERLLYNDIPSIEIKPKSIIDNTDTKTQEEKRPKNIGIFSNPAKNKKLKIVEDGGEL